MKQYQIVLVVCFVIAACTAQVQETVGHYAVVDDYLYLATYTDPAMLIKYNRATLERVNELQLANTSYAHRVVAEGQTLYVFTFNTGIIYQKTGMTPSYVQVSIKDGELRLVTEFTNAGFYPESGINEMFVSGNYMYRMDNNDLTRLKLESNSSAYAGKYSEFTTNIRFLLLTTDPNNTSEKTVYYKLMLWGGLKFIRLNLTTGEMYSYRLPYKSSSMTVNGEHVYYIYSKEPTITTQQFYIGKMNLNTLETISKPFGSLQTHEAPNRDYITRQDIVLVADAKDCNRIYALNRTVTETVATAHAGSYYSYSTLYTIDERLEVSSDGVALPETEEAKYDGRIISLFPSLYIADGIITYAASYIYTGKYKSPSNLYAIKFASSSKGVVTGPPITGGQYEGIGPFSDSATTTPTPVEHNHSSTCSLILYFYFLLAIFLV